MIGKINGMNFSLSVDPGAAKFFISYETLFRCKVMEIKKDDIDVV